MEGITCSLNSRWKLAGSTHSTPDFWLTLNTCPNTPTHPVILGHGNATAHSHCVYSVWLPIWMCPSHETVNGFPFPRAGQRDQTLSRSCQEGRKYQEEWGKSQTLSSKRTPFFPNFSQELKEQTSPEKCEVWFLRALAGEVFVDCCCWRCCMRSYTISVCLLWLPGRLLKALWEFVHAGEGWICT